MKPILLSFLVSQLCTLSVYGPKQGLELPIVESLAVFQGNIRIDSFQYVNDTIFLPDTGRFTIVYKPSGVDSAYSLRNPVKPTAPRKDVMTDTSQVKEAWININGSRRIGITIGRSVSINQSIDISLSGKIGDSTEVTGRLSDSRLGGNYQVFARRLDEFQQAQVKLKSRGFSLMLGDIQMGNGWAGRYQGMALSYESPPMVLSSSIGYSKEVRTSVSFRGRDGFQGPYFLKGPNGEDVTIVPMSERVTVNSMEMVRGREHDYTVDYEQGVLVFTPQRPIRDGDTIVVSFAYLQSVYTRRLIEAGAENGWLRVNFRSGKDELFGLSPSDIEALSEADSSAWIRGYRYVGRGKGDYALRDSQFVFVGAGNGDYIVHFEYVGDGNGSYSYNENGYFVFVGEGKGSFKVGKKVSTPFQEHMVSISVSRGVIINAVSGYFSRNFLRPEDRKLAYMVDGQFTHRWGMMKMDIKSGTRSRAFPPSILTRNPVPLSRLSAMLALGTDSKFVGLRMFNVIDTSFRTSGSEFVFGFEGAASFSGLIRNEKMNYRMRQTSIFKIGKGPINFNFLKLGGDTVASSVSLSVNSGPFEMFACRRDDESGIHQTLLLSAGFSHGRTTVSANANFFSTNDTVSKSASLRWSIGNINGYHEINYGASYASIEIYQFVGEGRGNYSFDPSSGQYYQDAGGDYIKVRKKLSSGEPQIWFKNHLEASVFTSVMSISTRIDLKNSPQGFYESDAELSGRLKITADRFLSLNAHLRKANDVLWGQTLDGYGELRLSLPGSAFFAGLSRMERPYLPNRKEKWVGTGFRRKRTGLSLKFSVIDGAASVYVVSAGPDFNIKMAGTRISLHANVYYGFLRKMYDSRFVTPMTMPIGAGYSYRITASKEVKKKNTLKVSVSGNKFRTRFNAYLDMRF